MISRTSSHAWLLALAALFLAACAITVCMAFPNKNLLIIAGFIGVPAFFAIAAWRPEVLLVACVFMPQWKNVWPLDHLSGVGDLTLIMLSGLIVGVLWRSLRHFSRLEPESLSDLFRGQWLVLFSYGLFCAAVLASYSYTSAPNYGGAKLARFLLIGTLLLVSGIILVRDENEFRRISLLFVMAGCITAMQLILHLKHRAITEETDITRIGAGWLLGMSVLLLLAYPLLRSSRRNLILVIITLPLLSAGLIASAARGPTVSLMLILPLTVFWFSKRRFTAGKALVSALLIASCVGSYLYLRHIDPDKYNSKLGELVQISRGDTTSGSGGKRLPFYTRTVAAIPDNLWLGQGIGSWSVFYYGTDARGYPHNLFLETTFEEGVVGECLLLLFLSLLAIATYHMLKATEFKFGVLAGLLSYCVSVSMFSGDLDDNRIIWLWAGITLAICRNAYLQRRRPGFFRARNQSALNAGENFSSAPSVFARSQIVRG